MTRHKFTIYYTNGNKEHGTRPSRDEAEARAQEIAANPLHGWSIKSVKITKESPSWNAIRRLIRQVSGGNSYQGFFVATDNFAGTFLADKNGLVWTRNPAFARDIIKNLPKEPARVSVLHEIDELEVYP